MEASSEVDGTVTVRMSLAESVVLHERIALAEWSNDLSDIDLQEPVEQKVFSDVQQALGPASSRLVRSCCGRGRC
jgi:hypothetical protein